MVWNENVSNPENDQGMSCPNCHPVREENARLRAEVARLEGLIVRCFGGHYEGEANAQLEAGARRIRGEK